MKTSNKLLFIVLGAALAAIIALVIASRAILTSENLHSNIAHAPVSAVEVERTQIY